ncbi:MAG: PspC domain-containing protein [Pseudonocardiaceae bacterium]|nr:PspC domain-containing protein [Pseudonocardiaceae bacterium]
MSAMNVEETVRDFWATRPRRPSEDRKLAGVAAGVGRRYSVDPVLVRIAFVVATIYGGVGVLLYVLGWLLLPAQDEEVSAAEALLGRGRSSVSAALTICLGLALIPVGGAVLGGDPTALATLALCLGALFLLHRHRAGMGELPGAAPATGEVAAPATGEVAASSTEPARVIDPDPTATGARSSPPAWDPLGAAPFAWDLPEPGTPPPPAAPPSRRPRSRVTAVTVGLALLAAGIAAAFVPVIGPAQVAGVALAVIGLGLVVGSIRHRGRGLIAVAVPLALLTWVLYAIPVTDFSAGERRWEATTAAGVAPQYHLTAGNGRLDLSDLRLRDGQTITTAVTVSFGEAEVLLPPDADVNLVCRAATGEVDCLGRTHSGFPSRVDVTDTGRDGPGGGTLVLDVRTGTGTVEVTRG